MRIQYIHPEPAGKSVWLEYTGKELDNVQLSTKLDLSSYLLAQRVGEHDGLTLYNVYEKIGRPLGLSFDETTHLATSATKLGYLKASKARKGKRTS